MIVVWILVVVYWSLVLFPVAGDRQPIIQRTSGLR